MKITSQRELDGDGILAWVGSFSWVAKLPDAERERMLSRVRDLLEARGVERDTHDVLHQVWLARLV